MKITMFAAAALAVALTAASALAEGPRASSNNTITRPAAQQISDGRSAAAHYEWQYHYVGHHPRYEGHWVLVN